MNRVQRISYRTAWCQLKRLQSSVSTSISQIQIPIAIKRGPTDILRALANTVPNVSEAIKLPYHDDPFLVPLRKHDYRNFALSYESGKSTAMWVHKQHSDLFPKHLSDPEIEAFTPPTKYTDKDEVSEEILLNAISQFNVSAALQIYRLLEDRTSNQTKQALLELLCFYSEDTCKLIDLPYKRWYIGSKDKSMWKYTSEINELYQFLTNQDPATVAAAHNVMICCLARYSRADKAWTIYGQCMKENVPLNVTTYNYVLLILPHVFRSSSVERIHYMLSILYHMNNKRIKPNVGTLNAVLQLISVSKTVQVLEILRHILTEFKRINVQLSLASYYHVLNAFTNNRSYQNTYTDFKDLLCTVKQKSFTIQDPQDSLFFPKAMQLANYYTDRNAADTIHNLLMTGNNMQFISEAIFEYNYWSTYLRVLLMTSTVREFFKHYLSIVPHWYVPTRRDLTIIVNELENHNIEDVKEYLPRLWLHINDMCTKHIELQFFALRLMTRLDNLPIDSPLRAIFVDAALTCARNIEKVATDENSRNYLKCGDDVIGCIANILVCNGRPEECVSILTSLIENPIKHMSVMSAKQTEQLFDACISQECIEGAFLVLQYSINVEYPYTTKMAEKLCKLPQLTNGDYDKLINLVGAETLNEPLRP